MLEIPEGFEEAVRATQDIWRGVKMDQYQWVTLLASQVGLVADAVLREEEDKPGMMKVRLVVERCYLLAALALMIGSGVEKAVAGEQEQA